MGKAKISTKWEGCSKTPWGTYNIKQVYYVCYLAIQHPYKLSHSKILNNGNHRDKRLLPDFLQILLVQWKWATDM